MCVCVSIFYVLILLSDRLYFFFSIFSSHHAAVAAMNGQYLSGSQIHVQFAYKKDGVRGERHGSAAGAALRVMFLFFFSFFFFALSSHDVAD